jgi:hypothetical protein
MKFLLSFAVALALTTTASHGYVSPSPPHESHVTTAPWTPKSLAQPPARVDVEGIFRNEYNEWAATHGKPTDEARFQIFKQNYMLQMQHNKKTGEFHDLNEHGDLTEAEFKEMMTTMTGDGSSSSTTVSSDDGSSSTTTVSSAVVQVIPNPQRHAVVEAEPVSPPSTPKVNPPVTPRSVRRPVDDVQRVHAELVFDEGTMTAATAGAARRQPTTASAPPKVTVMGQSNQQFARVYPTRALECIITPSTRTGRSRRQQHQSFNPGFGTQVIGVRSNPRVVRWEPGMPR